MRRKQMIKYLCNECGHDFKSDKGVEDRECPTCHTNADQHIMMSFSEPEDQKTLRGQLSSWDA